jgi:prepilin-type N-terminal cleavage/methylation domain-containing protein
MSRVRTRRGFTLVELLIVIAIIAMLIAMLLPAVQSSRESARRNQCSNNVKQLALGALHHVQSQGFFPSGGWGYQWTGDSNRGMGAAQPGGWTFSVLPYIEQTGVYTLAPATRSQTPVGTFYCPSRRPVRAYPRTVSSGTIVNGSGTSSTTPALLSKTDYAISSGTFGGSLSSMLFASNGNTVACLTSYPKPPCYTISGTTSDDNWYGYPFSTFNGVYCYRSEFKPGAVTDGLSQTLLIGEKYVNPDSYENSGDGSDNGDAWQGFDWDTARWSHVTPAIDTPGVGAGSAGFGSCHQYSFITAACDGSVRAVAYTISPTVWANLGNRRDGSIVSWK